MNDDDDPRRLYPAVAKNAQLWREFAQLLDQQEQLRLSQPHGEAARALRRYAEDGCARWAERLLTHFGYDITQSPPTVLPSARLELTDDELLAFSFSLRHYNLFDFAGRVMDHHARHADPQVGAELAIRGYFAAMRRAPWLADKEMQLLPFGNLRLAATTFVAGVLRTQLAPGYGERQNQRLQRVMENEAFPLGLDPKDALLEMLPSAVLSTVPPVDHTDHDLKTRKKAVVGAIEGELPILAVRKKHFKPFPAPDSDIELLDNRSAFSAEEEFLAVEAVRERQREFTDVTTELHRLWHAAGLTDRELEIMEYDQRGYKTGQIAAAVGTSSNAVSVQKHNARKKIRRYEREYPRTSA